MFSRRAISRLEFRQVRIQVQRLGVGEGVLVGNGLAFDYVPHRKFHLLPVKGDGDIGNGQYLCRYVTRRGVLPDILLYRFHQIIVEFDPRGYPDKEHDSYIVVPVLAHHDAIGNLIHGLNLR